MPPAASLRGLLDGDRPVVAPGAFNPLFALLIEEAGFDAVYLSGAGVANSLLGRPDIGILSLDDMDMVAGHICARTDLPVIADGDTGHGGVHNVDRTVRTLERAGVAAVQLEDQVFPKRCGHFPGKEVVAPEEMLSRIYAALDARTSPDHLLVIARTDARATHGLDEAIARARRYGDAGADILFVEAPCSVDELARVGRELSEFRLMANMVEFGKTPLLPAEELGALGYSLVIHPGTLTRSLVRAAREVLAELLATGSAVRLLDRMASFDDVNALVGLPEATRWEQLLADRVDRA